MRFLRGVTLILASLCAATLIAATEIAVGTPAVVSAPGTRTSVATASDGRDFLVVWNDTRTMGESRNSRLLASRVTREGKVLDPFGIIINAEPGTLPHAFFAGGAYVVVWARDNAFHAARIASDGTIVTPPRVVARGLITSSQYAATNGKTIVLVHKSAVSPYEMSATVLDLEMNLITVHSLAPGTAPGGPPLLSGGTIASNGDDYVVLWGSLTPPKTWLDSSLEAMRLDANGTPVDPAKSTIATASDIRIAGNASGYVFLAREPDRRKTEVRTTRALATDLSIGAAQVIPEGMQLSFASLIGFPERFLFFTYSLDSSGIEVREVAANGSLSNARTIVRSPAGFLTDYPVASSNGSEMLVAWIRVKPPPGQWHPSDYAVEAQVFDAASFAPKSDAVLLTKSANEQQHPAIAHGPNQHLVVWSERDGLWATRVENGVSLDGRGMQLAEGPTGPASVVFDGESYIVAWWQYAANRVAVYARFISPAGEIDDPLRFESSYANLTLATSGPATLMLWGDMTIQAVRLDRATRTASAPIRVPSNPSYALDLTAAWNGTHFLVAWAETRFDELPPFHPDPRATPRIVGLRLTESLGVVDATPRILAQSADRSLYCSLASDGTDWLLLWTDLFNLRARRITADGMPQGPVGGVVVGLAAAAIPAVIWDGARYAVAWRAGDYPAWTLPVHVAYISPSLHVATTLVAAPGHGYAIYEERVALSRAPAGIAIAYSRPSWEPQFGGVDRVFMKTFALRRRATR